MEKLAMKSELKYKVTARDVGKAFAIFVLLVFAWQAVKMGTANVNFYIAHNLTQKWLHEKSLTSIVEFDSALEAISTANQRHPDNPHYLVTQGLVHEWAGTSDIVDNPHNHLEIARKYYLNAVRLRPTWPVTYSTLAILKWRLGEVDQQMIDYLLLAEKFGPNTPETHQAWLEIGFYLYKSKSPLTVKVIKGLRKHLKLILLDSRLDVQESAAEIVRRQGVERYACAWMQDYSSDITWYRRHNFCKY